MTLKPKHIAAAAVIAAVIALVMTQKDAKWLEKLPARSLPSSQAEESEQQESSKEPQSLNEPSSPEESESKDGLEGDEEQMKPDEVKPSAEQTDDWKFILVNSDHMIDQSFKPELSEVQGGYKMDKRAVENAKQMIRDAQEQGVDLLVCSAYRPYESQQRIYNNNVDSLKAAGYSSEEAAKETLKLIAYPGTSEHQTGLALDIVTPSYQGLDDGYAKTDAAKWLLDHAAEYGFILRYPKDKQDITKISFEPWHYRFVGEEAAKKIMEKKICLEEYLSN